MRLLLLLLLTFNSFYLPAEEIQYTITDWEYALERIFKYPQPWMLEQIRADLAPFSKLDLSPTALDRFMDKYHAQNQGWLLVRIAIRSNHVFVQDIYTKADAKNGKELRRVRLEYMLHSLNRLTSCITVPNVDFILCLGDCLDGIDISVPVLAFSKNPKLAPKVVLIPDFEALSGNEHFLYQTHLGNKLYPWHQKHNRAIFRGSMTGGDFTFENFFSFPRTRAVTLSLQFPNLVDARFTCSTCQNFKERFPNYYAPGLSVQDHIRYKYQLLIDGNSCAYSRAYWQLFSNSVILKQSSENIQWYYRALQPYVHYIPINADMGNLIDVIRWTIEHDTEAAKISQQAQQFAKDNLSFARVMQYLYLLLVEYAKLQKEGYSTSQVSSSEGMGSEKFVSCQG